MLESIQIRNFAIIDTLQLELNGGMTALTGETGAGKSILLDAIGLAAGDRADSTSLRAGSERAEIALEFRLPADGPQRAWLSDNEMDAEGECLIRRVLYANGRSKAFINGYNATLSQLRTLCEQLIDIHGQHEHQSLQKPRVQRELLDSFVAAPDLLEAVRLGHRQCAELQRRLDEARSGAQARAQRIDLLSLYCDEMTTLDLGAGEFDTLRAEYRRLANAGDLRSTASLVLERLYEAEEGSVQSLLAVSERELQAALDTDPTLAPSHEMIAAALIQVEEATAGLRDYRDGVEIDGARLDELNRRIAAAQDLARKHRVEVDELPGLRESMQAELDALQGDAWDTDALQQELDAARGAYRDQATELGRRRRDTAQRLSAEVTGVMGKLGMDGGRFVIEVESREALDSAHGCDEIRYLVSANPGQPPRTLAKVASGGELSRISLAIQVVMSASSAIPTLIFDEVDSGVGGGTAEIVGRMLRLLGGERQVLCVTHLPQVASQAHHHYRVEKLADDGGTLTRIAMLDADQRVEEIARMLGGVTITEQTRAHAGEMIAAGE